MMKNKEKGRQLEPRRYEGEGELVRGWWELAGGCEGQGAGRFWKQEGLGKLL